MKRLRRWWKRLSGAIAGSRHEPDLAYDIETHLAMQTEANLKLGMSPEEARRAAVVKFGSIESVKEDYRDQRGLPLLETLARDVRFAFRSMRKNPEFAAAAILSLSLGIGATTATFSIANTVLFRTAYSHSERLATISLGGAITAPRYEQFRQDARSIERAALFTNWTFNLSGRGTPVQIPAARVSASLFELLGVSAQIGRTFLPEEDRSGRGNVVLIGDGLWRRQFGGDPNILGQILILNDIPHTVIGVMPPGFQFPEGPEHHDTVGPFPPAEMWRPMALSDSERTCGGCFNYAMLARLRPGVSTTEASTELTAFIQKDAGTRKVKPVTVLSLQNAVVGKVRTPILILFGAVTLALLIACVNVANLLLARGLRRREEIAIRLSLGATRARLVQQGLTEALTLAVCAAGLGLVVAWGAIRGLIAIAPAGIPRIANATVDARMFAFALGLALLTAIIFGVAPAILAVRGSPAGATRAAGRSATAAPSRLRSALVVAEFALSLILLVGSGLLARSFITVSQIPLGFRAENVLTMRSSLPQTRYDRDRRAALIKGLITNCAALPGVTAAAATSTLPLTSEAEGWGLIAEDNPNRGDSSAWTMSRVRAVTPNYFRTMGIRFRAGRDFNENDRRPDRVAILSESAARSLWPGVANPIGRRILSKPPITIVGIVDDTHASGVDTEIHPYLYMPFAQLTPEQFAVVVRSASDPTSLANAVKSEIWRMDKDQPVTHVATMKQLVTDNIAPRRFQAFLMTLLAIFAVSLAAIGTYGVLSYSVAQRTREIGIRMALGSSRRQVVVEVVRQALVLALAGATIGLIAAFRLTPLLESLLYGVSATEKGVFVVCGLLLLGIAILASIIPARRAANLDAMTCLRYE